MTVQDANRTNGYIVIPRRVGLGILGTFGAFLVVGSIAWATLTGRVSALEKSETSSTASLTQINARTISMETDIRWIRETMAGARR